MLPPQLAKRQRRPPRVLEHAWIGPRLVRLEEIHDVDPERGSDPGQGRDARVRLAPLDLAEEALAQACPLSDAPQRRTPEPSDRAQALTDVDAGWCR
jgi:hypothetical protein